MNTAKPAINQVKKVLVHNGAEISRISERILGPQNFLFQRSILVSAFSFLYTQVIRYLQNSSEKQFVLKKKLSVCNRDTMLMI